MPMFATVEVFEDKKVLVSAQFDSFEDESLRDTLSKVLGENSLSLEQPRFTSAEVFCKVKNDESPPKSRTVKNLTLKLHAVIKNCGSYLTFHIKQAAKPEKKLDCSQFLKMLTPSLLSCPAGNCMRQLGSINANKMLDIISRKNSGGGF